VSEVNSDFYEARAEAYAERANAVDMTAEYRRFLPRVRVGGRILDAGSGSGRDTDFFIKAGYQVSAFDASPAMCRISSTATGVETVHRSFADVTESRVYDGIWASASLVHLGDAALADAWFRLVRGLDAGGALYASFKLGTGLLIGPDGRSFHLMDPPRLTRLIGQTPSLGDSDIQTVASQSGPGGQQWISVVATCR